MWRATSQPDPYTLIRGVSRNDRRIPWWQSKRLEEISQRVAGPHAMRGVASKAVDTRVGMQYCTRATLPVRFIVISHGNASLAPRPSGIIVARWRLLSHASLSLLLPAEGASSLASVPQGRYLQRGSGL